MHYAGVRSTMPDRTDVAPALVELLREWRGGQEAMPHTTV